MKGLFFDNFYKTISSMTLFAFLILVAAIALLITGNYTILELFVYVSITALSANAVSSMRKDADAKWNKYELTLPVTRKEIIKCKYASYLFWVFVGTIIAAVITALAVIIHGNIFFAYGFRDVISLFSLGIGIAVMVGALFFPMAYVFGADRSETLLVISVIGSVGLAVLLVWLVNQVNSEVVPYYPRLVIFVLAYILLYFVSYIITRSIYNKKEF